VGADDWLGQPGPPAEHQEPARQLAAVDGVLRRRDELEHRSPS
jgi:hypothetical protein